MLRISWESRKQALVENSQLLLDLPQRTSYARCILKNEWMGCTVPLLGKWQVIICPLHVLLAFFFFFNMYFNFFYLGQFMICLYDVCLCRHVCTTYACVGMFVRRMLVYACFIYKMFSYFIHFWNSSLWVILVLLSVIYHG